MAVKSAPTALTLVSSVNPAPALSPVTFTANLTAEGKPFSAPVLFSIDGGSSSSAATDANGTGAYTTTLSAGTHTVKALFPGSSGYDATSASIVEIAAPNPTTTVLTPPATAVYQNQVLKLVSVVTATTGTSSPNGTVTLSEGGAVLAQAVSPISTSSSTAGAFGINLPPLTAGTHLLIATYTPANGNFLASTSQALPLVVALQSFTLSVSDPTLTLATEHHKTFSASVQSLGAFEGPVQLSCAVPQNVDLTCRISNSAVQLAANATAISELTLDTDAILLFKSSLEFATDRMAIALALILPLPLGFLTRRRIRTVTLMLLLLLFGATLSLTGCGNKYPAHTPPGNYDILITATGTSSGSSAVVTQSVHMQLTVTPE